MRDLKFKIWIPYRKIMMQPKSIQTFHEEIISGVTIGQMKQWIYLQFTGLKDKNGKEIYEGDVIKAYRRTDGSKEHPSKSEVTFLNGCYMAFNCTYHELYRLWQSEIEVIGNIYENPELVKTEQYN